MTRNSNGKIKKIIKRMNRNSEICEIIWKNLTFAFSEFQRREKDCGTERTLQNFPNLAKGIDLCFQVAQWMPPDELKDVHIWTQNNNTT